MQVNLERKVGIESEWVTYYSSSSGKKRRGEVLPRKDYIWAHRLILCEASDVSQKSHHEKYT